MAAMNKNIVVASVALLLYEQEQTRNKRDEHELFGQDPGCYAEKLTVISI